MVRVRVSGSTFRGIRCMKTLEEHGQVNDGFGQWKFPVSQQHLVLISYSWRQDISHSLLLLHGIWDAHFLKGMPRYVRETAGRQRQEACFTGGYFEDPKLVSRRVTISFEFICDALSVPEFQGPSETPVFLFSWVWTLNHHRSAVPLWDISMASCTFPTQSLSSFLSVNGITLQLNVTNKPQT